MNGFSGTYDLRPSHWQGGMWGVQIYEFQNDPRDPLTYEDSKGNLIRPDRHFYTDLASTPRTLQMLFPAYFAKDRFPMSAIMHDSSYLHNGDFFAVAGGWEFRELTRRQADNLLYEMCIAEGLNKTNACLVWLGVRIGGSSAWKRKIDKVDLPSVSA